jgi:AcrR family transcriptional regulator
MTGNWPAGSGGRARRDERREAIVAGALRLFTERGALPVRVEDIAEAVGISRATFYKYFSERDEILAELFRRLLATPPPEPQREVGAADRLTALLVGTARRMAEQEQLARFVYSLPLRHDAVLGAQAVRPAFVEAVAALVAECVQTGELRDDLPPATLTGHLVRTFETAMRDWAAAEVADPAEHVARMADLALAGCMRGSAGSSGPPRQR